MDRIDTLRAAILSATTGREKLDLMKQFVALRAEPENVEITKGLAAMNYVISNHADAIDAMSRKEIGTVSFYWGKEGNPNKKFAGGNGIAKIIAKRNSEGHSGQDVAKKMVEVIAKGEISEIYGPVGGERINVK